MCLATTAACNAPDATEPRQISRSGAGAYEASLTSFADGYAVAWYDTRHGDADIYVRLLDADGRPADPERRLTHDAQLSYEADIHAAGSNLAVAWYDKDADGRLQARIGLFSREGEPLWTEMLSSPARNGRNPAMAISGGELFAAWIEDDDGDASEVWAGWWNLAGDVLVAPRRVAPAGRTTWNLNVALDPQGRAWVAFDAKVDTRSEELFLILAGKASVEVVRLTADDGAASKYPDVAIADDRVALTWYDERDGNQEVYLAVIAWPPEGFEARARRVTSTPGRSIGAYVAWNGRRIGLAWSDDTPGQYEVHFQPFDAGGAPLAAARRLTNNATASLIPAIHPAVRGRATTAADAEAFALAWNEYTPPPGAAHDSTGRSEIAFTVVR